ncbi:hypothetical protein FIA58_017565 [Flavobacterium jejuense]|uniref:Uncharacterized protein n=1 Tax=Flavobacterium jejuense TaxID=1544455 RepID=A0ABX0IZT0_9FLAO|nr:hypothetical protein [Flavobacterium jejuense]NHN27491.1 hypothetical protein [Flavobacterium jejuense]
MLNEEQRTKSKDKRWSSRRVFLVLFFIFYSLYSFPQCAMCRAALESEESGVQAEAINDGIVYLMVIPYILVALAGYAIYRMKYAKKKEKTE